MSQTVALGFLVCLVILSLAGGLLNLADYLRRRRSERAS